MLHEPLGRLTGRFDVPVEAAAVVLILIGLLVIAVPLVLPWLIGLALVALGGAVLVQAAGSRRTSSTREASPPRV